MSGSVSDASLSDLLAEVRATRATLERVEAELCRRSAPPVEEEAPQLVPLTKAERILRMSNRQLRRWCAEEKLGVKIDGDWHVDLELVRQHKPKMAFWLATMSS